MKKILYSLSILGIISCGKVKPEGEILSKDIEIEEFSKLNLKGKFRLFFIPSDKNFVNVETNPNFADNLDINIDNNTLNIKEKRETSGLDFYNVTIYSKKNLEEISIADSVEMNVSGEIKSENIRINLKNNAKFIGGINTPKAEVEMTQKSRANFLGKTHRATLKLSDSAGIIAPYWYIKTLNINSQNGVYAEINVEDTLKGDVKNTAELYYYGNPVVGLNIDKKNAKVNRKNLK